ncbi:unnamed protein product [Parnassius apollo]|uniref:(apollo) hypothetical protein n=1 Tax=Parnassius apollo TaxID=110799 RepID=A0A8S3XTY5_PARAO|nr:unnamed protein product [Parnassius apollo]
MKFAVVVIACVLATAYAEPQSNARAFSTFGLNQPVQYNPYSNRYQNRYQNQYQNPYQNQYQNPFRNPNQNYKPIVSPTTAAPTPPVESVTVSSVPSVISAAAPVRPSPSPVPIVPVVANRAVSDSRYANILKYGSDSSPDGSFNYFFETDNGIGVQAQGTPRNFGGNPPVIPDVIQGSFSWVSPEGQPIGVTYVADENGYQPLSDAIPQPPPIPPQIARALDYLAKYGPQN